MTRSATRPAAAPEQEIRSLEIRREISIEAPPEVVWEAVLDELGPEGLMPGGTPFPMVIEPWPGGRWYRDLGNNAEIGRAHV